MTTATSWPNRLSQQRKYQGFFKTMQDFTIPAECHSDDRVVEINFDALEWFEQATDKQIHSLVDCGFGGDYPADEVSIFFGQTTTERLSTYLTFVRCGFECYVDEDAAISWIRANRPHLRTERFDD